MELSHATVGVWSRSQVAQERLWKVRRVDGSQWAGPVMDVEVLAHGSYVPAER